MIHQTKIIRAIWMDDAGAGIFPSYGIKARACGQDDMPKCGYDYPAKELKCPYCGEVNPLGEKWKNEENLARKETLLTKARVIHSMPLYVADKVMNVILLVITAVTALTFLVLAIVFGLEGIHITRQHNQASVQEAEELLVAEDYTKLRLSQIPSVYGQEV